MKSDQGKCEKKVDEKVKELFGELTKMGDQIDANYFLDTIEMIINNLQAKKYYKNDFIRKFYENVFSNLVKKKKTKNIQIKLTRNHNNYVGYCAGNIQNEFIYAAADDSKYYIIYRSFENRGESVTFEFSL